jgi:hypothetical protein
MFVDSFDKFKKERKAYNEKNDCFVVAFAIAFNTTYEKAHRHASLQMHRKHRRGTFTMLYFKKSLKKTPVELLEIPPKNTLSSFVKTHNTGRYIILVSGHALAMVDGTVYDYKYRPQCMVKYAFKIGN